MAKVVFLNNAQAEMLGDIFENEGAVVLVWPQVVTVKEGLRLIEFADDPGGWAFDDPDVLVEMVGSLGHPFVQMALEPLWPAPAPVQGIFDNMRKD